MDLHLKTERSTAGLLDVRQFEAHRLFYYSTLGLRVIKKKRRGRLTEAELGIYPGRVFLRDLVGLFTIYKYALVRNGSNAQDNRTN